MTNQYYKGFEASKTLVKWAAFIGSEESWIEETSGTRKDCSTIEQIEIPQAAIGDYKAKRWFEASCGLFQFVETGAAKRDPAKLEFDIPCKESLNALTNFDGFYGEKEFTTPWLIGWLSRENKLD